MDIYKQFREVEKQYFREKTSNEVSLKSILEEFSLLTNDFEHLLYSTLLEVEGEPQTEDELFEADFKQFQDRFSNISLLTVKFIKELRKTKEAKILQNSGYVKKLDNEIQKACDFYIEQMIKRRSQVNVAKIQNAFYAYIQLARAINSAIKEYNKTVNTKLPTLQNIPNPSDLGISVELEVYFANWLRSLNSVFN